MKQIVTVALVVVLLACGGANEDQAPIAVEATHSIEGPGVVAAPDGELIAYTVAGSGSPALVFIHGWMCDQSYWSEQVGPFSADHLVVTIDLPGHGDSGMTRDDWDMVALGGDVRSVVEHLDLSEVIVIGHSMGGPVALETARLMPDRVIGVIGVDALHDFSFRYEPGEFEAMAAAFEADFAGTMDQFVASMFHDGADPDLIAAIRDNMAEGPPEVGVDLLVDFEDYDMVAAVNAIDVPIYSINADLWPTDVDANRAIHADYDAVIVADVGHFLMMEAPEEFNQALEEVLEGIVGVEAQ